MRVRIKVCGITRPEDALAAVEAGVDAIGFNFATGPRRIDPPAARSILAQLPPMVCPVGLFLDAQPEAILEVSRNLGISTVQLHGNEPPETIARLAPLRVIKAFRVEDEDSVAGVESYLEACSAEGRLPQAVLLDTRTPDLPGGTGRTFDWRLTDKLTTRVPLILAGGLGPDNVAEAVRLVRPFGVDAASKLESEPGRKDPQLLHQFVAEVRRAEEELAKSNARDGN